MVCFDCCRNNKEEPKKKGVFGPLPPTETETATIKRGYIPWIWSHQFHQAYQLGQILGQGSFAIVHEAIKTWPPPPTTSPADQQQQQTYAVKIIQRDRMSREDLRHLQKEIRIMLDIRHKNIIQIHELFKTPWYFFVVMEKLEGGELFERLCERDFYSEKEARDVCRTVFEAVAYCHSHNIAHRDLKPENLLLVSPDCDSHVKIADFGFATRVRRPNSLTTILGSAPFIAPEIINYHPYDQRVDNWSLGVIVYNILGGYNPFHMSTVHMTHQQVRQANYQFDAEHWQGISPDARRMVRGLLTLNVDKRLTVQEALQHPWMTGRGDDLAQTSVNLKRLKDSVAEHKSFKQKVKSVSYYWLVSRR